MAAPPSPWDLSGARATTRADAPGLFVGQHLLPLLFEKTAPHSQPSTDQTVSSEAEFWHPNDVRFGVIKMPGFKVSDWFPRAPGVFWTDDARQAREYVYSGETQHDPKLGEYFEPKSKLGLIEFGGLGTIRLRPRRIDGVYCWLGTALTRNNCHTGIPLAIPESLLEGSQFSWGDRADLTGRVRFLQDAGLDDTALTVRGVRPLIVFVESLVPVKRETHMREVISPVVLFEIKEFPGTSYTFVQCAAGSDAEEKKAMEWVSAYADKYQGRVITNFDEQMEPLKGAPLSYQRLVTKTYDRSVIQKYVGQRVIERVDHLTINTHYGDTHVGDNINVSGTSGVVAIKSTLTNVTQTISSAPGLDSDQKAKLEAMIQSLKADLEALKASHPEEVAAISEAAQRAVSTASKPPEERKKSMLELTAKGLKDAAETVKDIAPNILATAVLIAKFIVGLH